MTNYKKLFFKYHIELLLIATFLFFLAYSGALAYKRYINYEFGKFDLGNMAQMVENTRNGMFMEVTDQFGTNMPRWGMSHVDPILVIFVPIFALVKHPLVLVLFQHLVIFSAIFPLYYLCFYKTNNKFASYIVVLTYLFYPANGFSVVWTGFHGISFVAPIFMWLVYYLEKKEFLILATKSDIVKYWILIILMLSGKEEIGAIIAIYSIFLYFRNKRLAIYTFIVSILWTLFCFLIVIPHYSDLRAVSIDKFVKESGVTNVNADNAKNENFFLMRYDYLGATYEEIALNFFLKPGLVFKKTFTTEKLDSLNNLFGPFLYFIPLMSIVWVISMPDILIVLLSNEEIFDISNHRIAFVTIALFVSYVYFLSSLYSNKRLIKLKFLNSTVIAILVLTSTVIFSISTANPVYLSLKSLVTEKIVAKVFARYDRSLKDININESRPGKVPRNNNYCLDKMTQSIAIYNPTIYTGPDYLGAHSSLRFVNAIFPARITDADMVIADIFETKAVAPLELQSWIFNKSALRKLYSTQRYKHLESCGKVSLFVKGVPNIIDRVEKIQDNRAFEYNISLKTKKFESTILDYSLPEVIEKDKDIVFEIVLKKVAGEFDDHVNFYSFEDPKSKTRKYFFIDYLTIAAADNLDTSDYNTVIKVTFNPEFIKDYDKGTYKVYYGTGDLLEATEVYLMDVQIK